MASLNVGSQIMRGFRGAQLAVAVKPYEEFLARLRMAERIAVVGGGVAGAEIAMALRYRGARVTLTPRIRCSRRAWPTSCANVRWTTGPEWR